ncbi:MAG: c-type cytochrome biogenesis protein CcsB [Desulfobacteraceae bacterium]|nr:MAG: c-type cytochrome biogenesis protein CcsB [Desulfobacteraceae bacterium]
MVSNSILKYITFIYLLSFVFYLLNMVLKKHRLGLMATLATWLGFFGHTAAFIMRWIESYWLGFGHAPLTNRYESFIFFSWTIALIYLIMEWRTRNKSIGVFVLPLAFLGMAYVSLSPDNTIEPLLPALKSNWLTVHVFTCFLGYAAFAVAFGLSLMFLLKKSSSVSEPKSVFNQIPALEVLDELTYQMLIIGFVFLTIGILTGAVWAQTVWGRYWGWDPKEIWSLITWVVYAVLLHLRLLVPGWHGARMAVLCIIGFVCVLFTFLGVNFLLSGLHSYG